MGIRKIIKIIIFIAGVCLLVVCGLQSQAQSQTLSGSSDNPSVQQNDNDVPKLIPKEPQGYYSQTSPAPEEMGKNQQTAEKNEPDDKKPQVKSSEIKEENYFGQTSVDEDTDKEKGKPQASIEEFLKQNEPPKMVPKETHPKSPENKDPKKPDICGSIIFDLTQKEEPINLKDSLAISMENNFDIKIFTQKAEKNKWDYYASIANFLPDVDFEQAIQRNIGTFVVSGIIPDSTKETAIQSNLFYDYLISASKYFNLKIAKNQYQSQKKTLESQKNQVLRDTATKYYDVLESKRRIEILETNIKQIKEQLRINKEKLDSGLGTKFDVLRAQADLASAKQSLTLAQNKYRFNQAQLANIIGIPVFIQLVPDDKDIKVKEIFKDCFDLDKAKEIAMSTRPDLQAAKFDIEVVRQRRNKIYANYLPDIALFGVSSEQGIVGNTIAPNHQFGVVAGWNIKYRYNDEVSYYAGQGLGLIGYTNIKSRTAELNESKLTYVKKSRDIEENLVRTFFNTVAARSIIDSTWAELQAAAESRNISVLRLKSGLGSFIDVLQAQSTYTTAKINHLAAVLGYDKSQVELLFEMGVISVNNILEGYKSDEYKNK